MPKMSRPYAVRLMPVVDRRLQEMAEVEGNTPSAVLRRVIALGMATLDEPRFTARPTDRPSANLATVGQT